MKELREKCLACRACPLGGQEIEPKCFSNVFSNMNLATVMVIGQNPGCFSIRTSIPTIDSGTIYANELVNKGIGKFVESYDFENDRVEPKKITNRFVGLATEDWYRLEWDGHVGYFTGDHKLSVGRRWKRVKKLAKVEYVDFVDWDLDYTHEQILLGTLLGDTGIYLDKRRNNKAHRPHLDFYQGQKQKEYLDWKLSFFKSLLLKNMRFNRRWSVYCQMTIRWDGFRWYWKYCKNRQRNSILPWIKRMGPIAWSVWYMDDGNLDKGYVSIRVNKIGVKNANRVCRHLRGMGFDVYLTVGKKYGNYLDTRIRFRKGGSKKFLEMVAPFIHPCLRYKLGKIRGATIHLPAKLNRILRVRAMRVSKQRGFDASNRQYAITVSGNHNHLLLGGVVSKNSEEVKQGEPFVGASGKFFNEAAKSTINMERSSFYISNVLRCYSPGNRRPTSQELDACRPILDEEIRLLKPVLIIALGSVAFERLTGMHGIMKHHGETVVSPRYLTPVIALLHPSPYNTNSPAHREMFHEGLRKVRDFLCQANGK